MMVEYYIGILCTLDCRIIGGCLLPFLDFCHPKFGISEISNSFYEYDFKNY